MNEEYKSYESCRAIAFLQKKKVPWDIYGAAANCKAVIEGAGWVPAPLYAEDGTINHGVDVLLYPLINDGNIVNIIAFEPKKKSLHLRNQDTNLWAVLDLISAL